MWHSVVHHDCIEVDVCKLQVSTITLLECRTGVRAAELTGPGDEHRRRIDPDRFGHSWQTSQHAGDRPVPQPISRTRAPDLSSASDRYESSIELLQIGCALLQDVGEALLHCDIDVRDRGVDIRHKGGSPPHGRLLRGFPNPTRQRTPAPAVRWLASKQASASVDGGEDRSERLRTEAEGVPTAIAYAVWKGNSASGAGGWSRLAAA